ncbi:hypothetical protein [Ornithinimicrobium sufpigmenti]|uniref:hypothetical protein n=1 Tax=Ornithinimicrobium sufpigmenti TaxID=2508882 RepID=UPI0011AE8F3C|nr:MULTISPECIES: hypothetical protein [unclassified Ornithinimicrobium]
MTETRQGARVSTGAVTVRPWALVSYLVLLAPVAMLGYGAYEPGIRSGLVEAAIPGIYSHASNLALSFALVLSYGLLRLLTGAELRELVLFTALVVAANYGYELWLPLFNTRDIMDARYGAGGALAALTFLVLVHRYGLRQPAG